MAGRPTVDCCLRCPRRPFRSPPPSGETRGEPDDGERGGLLLVCLAMLVVATRTSFVVALGTRARDRCTSLARSLPVASSPPAIRFRWKQHDRRGRTMGGGLLLVCCRPSPPRWFGLGDDAPPLLFPTAACIRRRFLPNRHRLCFCVAWGEGSRVRFRSFHRVTAMRRPANCRTSLCLFDPPCLHSLFVIPSLARALTRTSRTTTGEDYCALAAVFCRLTRQIHPAQCCTSLPAVLPCRSFAPSSPALAVRVSARPRGKSHEQHACDDGGGITA